MASEIRLDTPIAAHHRNAAITKNSEGCTSNAPCCGVLRLIIDEDPEAEVRDALGREDDERGWSACARYEPSARHHRPASIANDCSSPIATMEQGPPGGGDARDQDIEGL